MKARHWKLIGIVLVIGVAACFVTYADKDEAENISLPAAVKAAINNLYPQAVIEEAETDEEGLKVYELKLKQNGEEFEVTIAPDGALVEFESELAIENLPPAVAQALAKAAEGAVINEINEEINYAKVVLVKLDKPVTTYEADLTKDGVEIELKLADDGTILEQKVKNDDDEDEDDEDEDDEDDDGDEDEDEVEVSIDEVPAAVKATILREAEGGTVEEIELGDEDGQMVYEADVIINAQEVEIRVAEDGTLLSKQVEDEDDDDEGDDDEDDEEDDEEDDDEDDDDEDEEDD